VSGREIPDPEAAIRAGGNRLIHILAGIVYPDCGAASRPSF
jgi:hypothetical protein